MGTAVTPYLWSVLILAVVTLSSSHRHHSPAPLASKRTCNALQKQFMAGSRSSIEGMTCYFYRRPCYLCHVTTSSGGHPHSDSMSFVLFSSRLFSRGKPRRRLRLPITPAATCFSVMFVSGRSSTATLSPARVAHSDLQLGHIMRAKETEDHVGDGRCQHAVVIEATGTSTEDCSGYV